MYRLETLGRLTLARTDGREPVPTLPRKALGLLAILAAGGPMSRDRLMALLWPESDLLHARGSLKKTIHQLRQALALPHPVVGTSQLAINAEAISSDVTEFRASVDAGDLPGAQAAYGGPFLDGVDLRGSTELEHWIDTTRFTLQSAWAGAVAGLAEQAESRGDWSSAAAQWRALQVADPVDSAVAVRLMRALDAAGQTAAALAHAQAHQRSRRSEWELPDDPGVAAFEQELRAGLESAGGTPALPRVTDRGDLPQSARVVPEPTVRRWWSRAALVAPVIGVLFVLMLGARTQRERAAPLSGDPELVAVATFSAPDTALGIWREAVPDLLVRALDGAGPLRAARGLPQSRERAIGDRDEATRLGARLGAGLVLYGTVTRSGTDSLRLTATVFDRTVDGIVADVEVRGAEHAIEKLTDSLAVDVLRAMGRGRAIAATRQVSMVARSLPALRAFLRGEQFYRRNQVDSAMAHYHRAILADPEMAMAHRRLGWLMAANRQLGAAYGSWTDVVERAVALNRGLDPRDSLLLLADSLKLALGRASSPDRVLRDWFTRDALLEEAGRRFPFDAAIWAELGEARFHETSPLAEATVDPRAAFQRAVELDPGYALGYWHLIALHFRGGEHTVAAEIARAASELDPDGEPGSITLTSLVLDSGLAAPATQRALLAASPRALLEAGMDQLAWAADSAEAAVAILREFTARRDPVSLAATKDPNLRSRFLAQALAFRGHLRAAAATGMQRATDSAAFGVDAWNDPFTELALLGAVPDSFAQREFARAFDDRLSWGTTLNPGGIPRFLRGMPWWYSRGDTASLERFVRRARRVADEPGHAVARLRGRYFASVAPAYVMLVRGDSGGARRHLEAASDSLCIAAPCQPEKWLLARLLAAAGDHQGAARLIDRWQASHLAAVTPSSVLMELQRGDLAERMADTVRARRAYRFVTEVWRGADEELQVHVQAARAGLERLSGRAP